MIVTGHETPARFCPKCNERAMLPLWEAIGRGFPRIVAYGDGPLPDDNTPVWCCLNCQHKTEKSP